MQPPIDNHQFDTILQNPTEIRACARSVCSRPHARTRGTPPETRPPCAPCPHEQLTPPPSFPTPKPHHFHSPFAISHSPIIPPSAHIIPTLLRHSREGGNPALPNQQSTICNQQFFPSYVIPAKAGIHSPASDAHPCPPQPNSNRQSTINNLRSPRGNIGKFQ